MLHYLIYVSKAAKLMDEEDLNAILKQSRSRNSQAGVTGMLLYLKGSSINNTNGNFIQVLEGKKAEVKKLFDKIKANDMHHSVVLVAESPIEKRNFSDWVMGFKVLSGSSLSHPDGYINIEEFYKYQSKPKDFNVALNYLKTFYSMYS